MSINEHWRFETTVKNLQDCYANMENLNISPLENRKRLKLISLCIDIATEFCVDIGLDIQLME